MTAEAEDPNGAALLLELDTELEVSLVEVELSLLEVFALVCGLVVLVDE